MTDEPFVSPAGIAPAATAGRGAWRVPSRLDAAWFAIRAAGLTVKRALRDAVDADVVRHARHVASDAASDTVLAQSRTPLWTDGRPEELVLVAGKVHNLRVARKAFDGVVVPAGATFSFWKQLGWPGRARGYVEGREIRSGCVVPTIAGGICQLTQALARCAQQAGFRFTERHGHTARIEATADTGDTGDVDATVFWNYLDLRFVAPVAYRIDVELDVDDLLVRFVSRAHAPTRRSLRPLPIVAAPRRVSRDAQPIPVARGCLSCDQTSCFRHRGTAATGADAATIDIETASSRAVATRGRSAWLLNGHTTEWAAIVATARDVDLFVPSPWPVLPNAARNLRVFRATNLLRRVALRARLALGGVRQAAVVKGDVLLAHAYARALGPLHTHLLIDQSLLLALAQAGALAGRRYEVYVHALPAGEVQRRLERAQLRWPLDASLRDFRQSAHHCDMERRALLRASRLITPHADVAAHLHAIGAAHVELLPWHRPAVPAWLAASADSTDDVVTSALAQTRRRQTGPTVVFPASALARKGAREFAQALRGLPCRLLVLGTPSSDAELWRGIDVQHASYRLEDWLAQADVVVLPAHVEHAPRSLLVALAAGIPVIATAACGVGAHKGLLEVPAGDVQALRAAMQRVVGCRRALAA